MIIEVFCNLIDLSAELLLCRAAGATVVCPMFFLRARMPSRFRRFYAEYRHKPCRLLDVGCGNHSATKTMKWFPQCEYHGVDKGIHENDDVDFAAMASFHDIDLIEAPEKLDAIPDDSFDVVLMCHVIEHLPNGIQVLRKVAGKVVEGGKIYLEFPSVKSLGLPNMHRTLNFCDDLSHVRLYGLGEVANELLTDGFRIIRGGARRDWRRMVLLPVMLACDMAEYGRITGGSFWDWTGCVDYIYAEKR